MGLIFKVNSINFSAPIRSYLWKHRFLLDRALLLEKVTNIILLISQPTNINFLFLTSRYNSDCFNYHEMLSASMMQDYLVTTLNINDNATPINQN